MSTTSFAAFVPPPDGRGKVGHQLSLDGPLLLLLQGLLGEGEPVSFPLHLGKAEEVGRG